MAYLVANQFELGLDLRKSPTTAPPSSFRALDESQIDAQGARYSEANQRMIDR